VFFEEGLEKKDEAFGVAKAIRNNPKIADRCSGRVLDLRGRGRRDSTQAVPPFLYGLLWARVDDEGNHDPASFDQVAFYCPVMLARMLDYQPTLPVAVPSLDDGSNSTPESTSVDPPSDPAQPYHAELRRWLVMSGNNPKIPHYLGDRTFGIYEAQGEDFSYRTEQGVGPLVATLTVEPRIDIESAARMAGLVCLSPDLWRELRDQNRHRLTEDGEQLDTFARTTRLLMAAAGRPPYDVPNDCPDEVIFQQRSDATVAPAEQAGRNAA
jgi:hypothetical protein